VAVSHVSLLSMKGDCEEKDGINKN